MFTIEFWENLFFNPDFAEQSGGPIIASIIAGSFTLVAASISLYVYFSRKARQSTQDFLQWLSNTNVKFQSNESYQTIRESIAQNRSFMLLYIALELYLTPSIDQNESTNFSKKKIEDFLMTTFSEKDNITKFNKNLPFKYFEFSENGIEEWKYQINWNFVRKFTDYTRFFEETLISCEELSKINNSSKASTLIDCYYWHIKSIIFGWNDDYFNKLFIHYLLHNHLDRLLEISIFFINERDQIFTNNILSISNKLFSKSKGHKSKKSITKKWKQIIDVPTKYSGGVIIPEILDFSKRQKSNIS